jgi:2-hydroxy-6-oxo-6-(2'-aminophenyl)hexa-2,4-dienoate hydrolase
VVLVHGGGAGADAKGNWTGVIARLAERHRVFAPDMVGFGGTAKPRDGVEYSQGERDAHLAAFVEAAVGGPATLVGNSMGGLTALGVARKRPELVSGLVLMGSAGLPIKPSPQLQAIVDYDFTEEGMARIVEALTGPDFVAPEGMVAYRHALSVEPDTQHAYKRITAWQKANGGLLMAEDDIAAVRCPTLVVAGKNDGVVPVANAYRFIELIDQSWGVVMPRCGHWPMIEYPDAFADLVDRFVARA